MGSWDESCIITHLPISSGDEVKLLFLMDEPNQRNINGYTGPCGLFYPFGLPISCKYDDYGQIKEVVEDLNTKFILSRVKKLLELNRLTIIGSAYDKPVDLEKLSIENLVEFSERGRVKIKSASVTFWPEKFIPDDADKKYLSPENFQKEVDLGKIQVAEMDSRPWNQFSFCMMHESAYRFVIKSLMTGASSSYIDSIKEGRKWFDRTLSDIKKKKKIYSPGLPSNRYPDRHFLEFFHIFLSENNFTDIEISAARKSFINLDKFLIWMGLTRRLLHPNAGAGSQALSYLLHKELAGFVVKKCGKNPPPGGI